MATCSPDLMFPYLKDHTKLMQHEDVLYKVKITYDHKSFSGRKVTFTRKELSYDIGQFLKAVLYMCEKRIKLKPIYSDHLLVLPAVQTWIFPTKYPTYRFKRNGKVLKTSDVLIELTVKHIDEVSVRRVTDVPDSDQRETEAISKHPQEEQGLLSKADDQQEDETRGSRFVRDENGRLVRYMISHTQSSSTSVPMKNNSKNGTKKIDFYSQKGRGEAQNSVLKTGNHQENELAKDKLRSQRKLSTSRHTKEISSSNQSPGTCIDCLEERQERRHSRRLMAKREINNTDKLIQNGTILYNKNNSCLDQPTCSESSLSPDVDSKADLQKAKVTEHRKSPRKAPKRNTREWCGNAERIENNRIEMKRRKRDPVTVYQDILQNRNKDRHLLEQLEREETKKLGELYEVKIPRRSDRNAEKSQEKPSGKLSGLWNKVVDIFFTPKK